MLFIGDIVEKSLRFCGITKERVAKIAGKKNCGCQKRQEAMNQWGLCWQLRMLAPYYRLLDKCRAFRERQIYMRLRLSGGYLAMAVRVLIFGR